jgi:hypothetical protein
MKFPTDPNEHTPEELKAMIAKMRGVISDFYVGAQRTGVHPFLEFCGLMSKYADVCEAAIAQDIDFTTTSIHGGQQLPVAGHDLAYLAEKFGCIFSGMLQTDDAKKLFCKAAGLDLDEGGSEQCTW